MIVIETSLSGVQYRSVFGLFNVPAKWYAWILLVVFQLLMTNVSLLGHLCGILSGFAYTYGLFNFLLPGSSFYSSIESSSWLIRSGTVGLLCRNHQCRFGVQSWGFRFVDPVLSNGEGEMQRVGYVRAASGSERIMKPTVLTTSKSQKKVAKVSATDKFFDDADIMFENEIKNTQGGDEKRAQD
ncbi:Rhomboid-like protein 15 [Camellia lanceoleosa]|uniref:Rhomboid-like protein 15 n=1 Tax=Camellia lanceoleosa TaxID=1840588 RepID=A0ACC0GEV5_9ERIC|nr:Rhomboid-like protein 15 [Camellia lanceoleosa]